MISLCLAGEPWLLGVLLPGGVVGLPGIDFRSEAGDEQDVSPPDRLEKNMIFSKSE